MENKIKKALNELTNEELLKLFRIARGVIDNYSIENVQRWSTSDIMVDAGMVKIFFGIVTCENQNDARLGIGYSFIMKEFLSKNILSVSDSGIEESREDFTESKMVLILNQNKLFERLKYMGYL